MNDYVNFSYFICNNSTGGEWLVCDMQRQVSVFEDDSSAQVRRITTKVLVALW